MTEVEIFNKYFKTAEDYTQANILNAILEALHSESANSQEEIKALRTGLKTLAQSIIDKSPLTSLAETYLKYLQDFGKI